MVISRQNIDTPHPIYETIDKTVFSFGEMACIKIALAYTVNVNSIQYTTDLVTTGHIH